MSTTWIYHERQEALLCGQHALNNLVQASEFTPGSLAEIGHQLDREEMNLMAANNEGGIFSKDYLRRLTEGSGNVDEAGNFSIEVLRAALMNQYNLQLPNIEQDDVWGTMDITEMEGFVCNRSAHWFAIRKINGRFWNLNSTLERPEVISHFRLATEIESLQHNGYSVFCVPKGLPPPCTSALGRSRGYPQFWWKEDDLLGDGSLATSAAPKKWDNVGSGMRLDGKATKPIAEERTALTEDQLVSMAIEESFGSASATSVPVPDEPPQGTPGAVRIQIRLPDGKRRVRRFLDSNSVAAIFAYVQSTAPNDSNKRIELRYGFPPKVLDQKDNTIGEMKLSGDSIQCRYV